MFNKCTSGGKQTLTSRVFTIKSSSEDMMDVYNMEEIICQLQAGTVLGILGKLGYISSTSRDESRLIDPAGSDAMALLMPRPLLLSTSNCPMGHGGLDRGPCRLPTIHTLILYIHNLRIENAEG